MWPEAAVPGNFGWARVGLQSPASSSTHKQAVVDDPIGFDNSLAPGYRQCSAPSRSKFINFDRSEALRALANGEPAYTLGAREFLSTKLKRNIVTHAAVY